MSRRARRVSLRAIRRSRRSRSSSRWSPSRASCSEATRLAARAWSRVRRCGGGTPTAAYRQARDGRVRIFVLAAPSLGSTPFRSRPPPTEILLYLGWCNRRVLPVLSAFSTQPSFLHIKDCPTCGARTSRHGGRCSRRSLIACVLGSLATVGVLCPLMVSRRRSVRQLRGPPFGRDDPHREVEGAPIERLGELGDSDEIVA